MIKDKIDVFNLPSNILNKKTNKYITIWNTLFLLFISILILIIMFYEFNEYETCLGYVKKIDDYKVVIYLKDFSKINEYELYLDDEAILFDVYSISSEYYIINNEKYYEIILNVKLKDTYKIENNILNLKFKKNKTTYLKKIKEGIGI
ncbi:MAG: hypothetical protein E7170_04900 [Firmicutes bacterium]|nr:hypothetical protein [Bacillota bacterium]